jgi:hypothetical protein
MSIEYLGDYITELYDGPNQPENLQGEPVKEIRRERPLHFTQLRKLSGQNEEHF